MRSIDMPPYAPVLMESTRAIGYSIETAIADVIDNSIAARATRIDIDYFPSSEAFISIYDNGLGMSDNELIAAMQYGSRSPLEIRDDADLGRFGLGLKTASLSQCRILTVLSKKNGSINGCQWNLDHIRDVRSWALLVLDDEEMRYIPNYEKLIESKSGTLVVWQNLDKFAIADSNIANAFSRKMDAIREHLSLVFHRYLSGESGLKKIDIRMNNMSISYTDPFLVNKSTLLFDEEIIKIKGKKIRIRPFILPHISALTMDEIQSLGGKEGLQKKQGFYVYRNKRLLIWGTWFRLMRQGNLSKLARVQVDLPNSLDDLWTLDIKKSTATPPEEVRKNLATIIDRICEGSKRTWTYRGKKETSDKVIHLWNRMKPRGGGIYYELNSDHPMIKSLVGQTPSMKVKVESLLKQISLTLPLNSLYVDLTNDEKLINDNETPATDIIALIKTIVSGFKSNVQRYETIEALQTSEPFCDYINEINDAKDRGEFDG